MKTIVFIIRDRCIGGFSSSLSSLYNSIKGEYKIKILQLSSMGTAAVSYNDVVMKHWWLCDYYYNDYTLAKGMRKFMTGLIHALARFDKNLEKRIATHYNTIFADVDCVIAFGESLSSNFTQHIKCKKKIAWIHYDVTFYSKSVLHESLYRQFDKIVCVADAIADGMRKMYPSLSSKICGIHNVFDKERITLLANESIPETFHPNINIISLGRLATVKRFFLIPGIAKKLKNKGLSFKWWILGPAIGHVESDKLLSEILLNDVADCVEWIGNRKNPYPYIYKSDILVSTSSTEACPMIFNESRILDTLIVSADFLTANEFINDGVDGVVSSIENMADRIFELSQNKKLCRKLKKNSILRGSGNEESLARFKKLIDEV